MIFTTFDFTSTIILPVGISLAENPEISVEAEATNAAEELLPTEKAPSLESELTPSRVFLF